MEGMLGIIFVVALIYWIFKKRPSPDVTYVTTAAKPTGGKAKKGGDIMDISELPAAKRELGLKIEQEIREFEEKSGMVVKGFKIKRLDNASENPAIESVTMKVEIPEMD